MTDVLPRRRLLATVDPVTDERWARLVATSRYATLFHSPPWLRALARTYDFTPEATILSEGGTEVAGMAYVRVDDIRGMRVVSNPFSDFCDPLADSAADWEDLTAPLLSDPAPFTMRVRHCPWPLQDARMHSETIGYWHAIDVAEDEAAQWAQLGQNARRNVRRAQSSGVVVEVTAAPAALRAFFELHRQVRKYKYRLLAQPWAFFEHLLEEFAPGGGLHVLLLRAQGRAIAGLVLIEWGDTLYLKFSASALDALEARPNDLLAWEALNLARRQGLRRLDWGFSDADQPGLVRFKRKTATVEALVHRVSSSSPPPSWNARMLSRDLSELTRLLTDERVPDDLTEAAGALLYRYFV